MAALASTLPTAQPLLTRQQSLEHKINGLCQRSDQLRNLSADADPIVASAMRRRASELELEAFVIGMRFGPRLVPTDAKYAA